MNKRVGGLVILVLSSSLAYGVWAAFAHVTPETMDKFDMPVCVSRVADNPELIRIVFPLK